MTQPPISKQRAGAVSVFLSSAASLPFIEPSVCIQLPLSSVGSSHKSDTRQGSQIQAEQVALNEARINPADETSMTDKQYQCLLSWDRCSHDVMCVVHVFYCPCVKHPSVRSISCLAAAHLCHVLTCK